MPMYTYVNDETGEVVERIVSISERDNQAGLTRCLDKPALVYAPTAGGMK